MVPKEKKDVLCKVSGEGEPEPSTSWSNRLVCKVDVRLLVHIFFGAWLCHNQKTSYKIWLCHKCYTWITTSGKIFGSQGSVILLQDAEFLLHAWVCFRLTPLSPIVWLCFRNWTCARHKKKNLPVNMHKISELHNFIYQNLSDSCIYV